MTIKEQDETLGLLQELLETMTNLVMEKRASIKDNGWRTTSNRANRAGYHMRRYQRTKIELRDKQTNDRQIFTTLDEVVDFLLRVEQAFEAMRKRDIDLPADVTSRFLRLHGEARNG